MLPHALSHLLHNAGNVGRVGHHAVVRDLGARHHAARGATVQQHMILLYVQEVVTHFI